MGVGHRSECGGRGFCSFSTSSRIVEVELGHRGVGVRKWGRWGKRVSRRHAMMYFEGRCITKGTVRGRVTRETDLRDQFGPFQTRVIRQDSHASVPAPPKYFHKRVPGCVVAECGSRLNLQGGHSPVWAFKQCRVWAWPTRVQVEKPVEKPFPASLLAQGDSLGRCW
jgi:hypothetical protein